MNKEMKQLMRQVKDQGCEVTRRRNGHMKIQLPMNKEGKSPVVFCSHTPSDRRALENIKRDLRNAGLNIR